MKRHRTDAFSLVSGLIFILVAVWWTLGRTVEVGLGPLAWAIALALIVLGGVGLLGVLRGREPASRDTDAERDEWQTR